MLTPQPPRRRRSQQGVGQPNIQQPDTPTGLCFARPHLAGASATRCAGGAERSDGPNGCPIPVGSLLYAPGARRARGGMRVGARMLRELTHRSCPSGARQRKASSTAHPATAPPQVCPVAQRRGRRLGVAVSLVTFFWRSKRKLLACRATPGSRTQHGHAVATARKLREAQPKRTGRERTIKTIAASALCRSASSQKTLRTNDSNRAEVGTALLPKARGPASQSTPLTRLPAFRQR